MPLIVPQACPHCGGSIADLPRVGARTLAAAQAVATGAEWSDQVARRLALSLLATGNLLRRAERDGLIRVLAVESLAGGGRRFRYAPTRLIHIFESPTAPPRRRA